MEYSRPPANSDRASHWPSGTGGQPGTRADPQEPTPAEPSRRTDLGARSEAGFGYRHRDLPNLRRGGADNRVYRGSRGDREDSHRPQCERCRARGPRRSPCRARPSTECSTDRSLQRFLKTGPRDASGAATLATGLIAGVWRQAHPRPRYRSGIWCRNADLRHFGGGQEGRVILPRHSYTQEGTAWRPIAFCANRPRLHLLPPHY